LICRRVKKYPDQSKQVSADIEKAISMDETWEEKESKKDF